MKRELGIGRCGLACCLCSENDRCMGCNSEDCPDKERCGNRKCSMGKGYGHCFECDQKCRKGLLSKIKPYGFTEFVKRYGLEELLNRLERNERNGIVYHREGINGDYDDFEDLEELIDFIRTGINKKPEVKRIEIFGDNYFGHWGRERIACRGIVIQDDRILLSYETKTDTWMLPGGGLENGEDASDCCVREVSEETGFVIEPLSCALQIDEYYENCRYATKYFLASIKDRCETRLTDREKEAGMEPRWLSIDEAIDIFSTHTSFADNDEMKRGLYQREYTALRELFGNTKERKKPKDMI